MTQSISNDTNIICPCGSQELYQKCCQPFHMGTLMARDALQLMRSRYSAFCLGHSHYLIGTLLPENRQQNELQLLTETMSTSWLGLKIIAHTASDDYEHVEFVAFYQSKTIDQLHERSRFIQQGEQWFYVDGQWFPPIKLARNEPCFCGSGKKLKKCHPV